MLNARTPARDVLTDDGQLSPDARRKLGLDPDGLVDLYRRMVMIRRADQEALNLQRQGELGLWGQFLGQEAAQVGAVMALRASDWIVPSYREFGMAMTRGIDPGDILAYFRGYTHGPWDVRRHRFLPFAIPVASQVPHGVGLAMGCKLDASGDVVLVTFGDGATSEGDWHEALNFAGVFRAPVVFLCQNNHWAISVPLSKQTAGSIAARAAGYGFPGIRIDGNDVLAVYAATCAAAEQARDGEGPTLIEAVTYRMGAHTTADDPTRYRADAELHAWRVKDPILRYETWLRGEGLLDDGRVTVIQNDADEMARRMRDRITQMPMPDPATMIFDRVYANPPDALRHERDAFLASLEPPG